MILEPSDALGQHDFFGKHRTVGEHMHLTNRVVEVCAQENCDYASIVRVTDAFDELPRRLGRVFTQAGSVLGRSWLDAIGRRAGSQYRAFVSSAASVRNERTAGYQIGKHRIRFLARSTAAALFAGASRSALRPSRTPRALAACSAAFVLAEIARASSCAAAA